MRVGVMHIYYTCVFGIVIDQLLRVLVVALWVRLRRLDGGVRLDGLQPPAQPRRIGDYVLRDAAAVVLQDVLHAHSNPLRAAACQTSKRHVASGHLVQDALLRPHASGLRDWGLHLSCGLAGPLAMCWRHSTAAAKLWRYVTSSKRHVMRTCRRNQGASVASTSEKLAPRKSGPVAFASPSSHVTSARSFSAHSACCCLSWPAYASSA